MRLLLATVVVPLVLCGCQTVAPPAVATASSGAASAAAPTTAQRRSNAAAALGVERGWLAAWFRGTPVLIAQRGDGAVTVEVPREFCFEPGDSRIKPALAAVLGKVADSMRRLPAARLPLLAAPPDPGAAETLALQRALKVRDYLLARGVAAARLGPPAAAGGSAVQLRMEATTL